MAAGFEVKQNGGKNDLLERLGKDANIPFSTDELESLLADYQSFTGRAEMQTTEFLDEIVEPVLRQHSSDFADIDVSLHV